MTTANIPRLCLAASSSGAGKTTVTCALLAAFKARGLNITAFKCGPDYIDPLFHREICGTPSSNLDLFMLDAETVLSLFERRAAGSSLALIEGVMGLYDGIGISEKGSTWEAARLTQTPVVLVEDCRASALSAAARISGLARFREPRLVRGVILNNCGETLFAIERETGISVYGFLPCLKECRIESRHLGLLTPEDIENVRQKIALLCEAAQKNIDLEGLLELAKSQTPPAVDAQGIAAEIPQAAQGEQASLAYAAKIPQAVCGTSLCDAEELERKSRKRCAACRYAVRRNGVRRCAAHSTMLRNWSEKRGLPPSGGRCAQNLHLPLLRLPATGRFVSIMRTRSFCLPNWGHSCVILARWPGTGCPVARRVCI